MRKYLMQRVLSVALALLLVLSVASPVYAIADPLSAPSINAVYVYEGMLEDGDVGVLIDYYIDYAVLPTETATESYLGVFIDTDGVTQIRSVAPYAFPSNANKGYRWGLMWIYFTAAEAATYGLDSAQIANYRIWVVGNPTIPSGWAGDPPKTVGTINYWQTTGDSAILIALRILYYATQFELAWSPLDMIQETTLGNRLTSTGENYFTNVIANLRTIAPGAFAAGTVSPVQEDLDYATTFGAVMTNGTGTVVGSPITLTEGANTVTVTVAGTFTLELNKGTIGTVANGTGTVNGSPVSLVAGTNTIVVPGGGTGTLIVTVNLSNTQTAIDVTVAGTGFDLTTVAALFGMSRLMFSCLVWLVISIVVCAGFYRAAGGKAMLLVFDLCIIGGAVLGLVPILIAALLFIGFGVFTGYILFFRGAGI